MLAVCGVAAVARGQWALQDSGTTASFRGVHYVGNGVAWVSGTRGTVLRTVDMGKTWVKCAVPEGAEKLDFRGVQAFDAKTAIVMSSGPGDASRLYKTVDGCGTWKLVFTNPDKDGFFDGIIAQKGDAPYRIRPKNTPQQKGLVEIMVAGDPVGGSFTLFDLQLSLIDDRPAKLLSFPSTFCHDSDPKMQLPIPVGDCLLKLDKNIAKGRPPNEQAANQERYQVPVPKKGEALFAASNSSMGFETKPWYAPHVFLVTGGPDGARFLQFRADPCAGLGCESWTKSRLPLASGAAGGAFSVAVVGGSPIRSVVVGGDYLKPDDTAGTAAFTADEGITWKPSATMPHGYRSAVAYSAKANAWIAVGPNGTDVSWDDGRNWTALKPGPGDAADADQKWNALSLPFVVGEKGRIGILRDGVLGSGAKGAKDAKGSPR